MIVKLCVQRISIVETAMYTADQLPREHFMPASEDINERLTDVQYTLLQLVAYKKMLLWDALVAWCLAVQRAEGYDS